MDITRENFQANLPGMLDAIDDCDFLAIDCEFTGLYTDESSKPNLTDSFAEIWSKAKLSAENFALLQLGICTFKWRPVSETESSCVEAKPFNIYISKRPSGKSDDSRFMYQSSSMEFLAQHGFDFSRAIKNGISYLNAKESEKARQGVLEEERKVLSKGLYLSPTPKRMKLSSSTKDVDFKALVDQAIEKVNRKFDEGETEPQDVLPSCHSFYRRYVYSLISSDFPLIHVGKFPEDNKKLDNKYRNHFRLRITKCESQEHVQKLEKLRAEKSTESMRQSCNEAIGITLLIEKVISAKKPVIGHNCLLDIAHLTTKCIGKQSDDVEQFRKCLKSSFYSIIDTKHLLYNHSALRKRFPRNGLGMVYEATVSDEDFRRTNPEVVFPHAFERYAKKTTKNDTFHHEAGYDALMTGLVYARIVAAEATITKDSGTNKLASFYDAIYLNGLKSIHLNSPIEETGNRHILHVYNLPGKMKTWHINQLFSKHELMDPDSVGKYVPVQWIDNSSAFVCMFNEAEATRVLQKAKSMQNKRMTSSTKDEITFGQFCIESYSEYERRTNATTERMLTNSKKRRRVSSTSAVLVGDARSQPIEPSTKENTTCRIF